MPTRFSVGAYSAMLGMFLASGIAKADSVASADFGSSARRSVAELNVDSVSGITYSAAFRAAATFSAVNVVGGSAWRVGASKTNPAWVERLGDYLAHGLFLLVGYVPSLSPATADNFRDSGPMVLYGAALLLLSRITSSFSKGKK